MLTSSWYRFCDWWWIFLSIVESSSTSMSVSSSSSLVVWRCWLPGLAVVALSSAEREATRLVPTAVDVTSRLASHSRRKVAMSTAIPFAASFRCCRSSDFRSFFSRRSRSLRSSSSSGMGSPLHVCGCALCAGRPGPFFVCSFLRHLARRFWNQTYNTPAAHVTQRPQNTSGFCLRRVSVLFMVPNSGTEISYVFA